MSQDKNITLEYYNQNYFKDFLTENLRKSLDSLTIEIKDNKNIWYSYSINPFDQENASEPSFRIKEPVYSIPSIGKFHELKYLDVSFLGLNSLPDDIIINKTIRHLNISFNFISLDKELEKLKMLPELEVLAIFGLSISKEILEKLQNINPDIDIYYTREDNIQYLQKFK